MMRGRRLVPVAFVSVVAACGARTGLLAPEPSDAEIEDARHDVRDAAEEDVIEEDVVADVVFPDVPIISDCPDAGETLVYLLGANNEFYSFFPPALKFKPIGAGKISCPGGGSPNSMAVTRSGIAFTNFQGGNLFEISTANAACKATPYVPSQNVWQQYGMGYAGNADGGETLYVSGNASGQLGQQALGLGMLDTQKFVLDVIGQYQPAQPDCELTGTSSGRLFGFCPFLGNGSTLIEIDPATAKVLSSHKLKAGSNQSFAFAFWGGAFWIFTGHNNPSTVTKYDPNTDTETNVATAPIEVVGAGVSTCAPL